MASEAEPEHSTPKLPLFSIPAIKDSPEHPGMVTPPLYTLASVPFTWEEEPGKPRPCTTLITLPNTANNEPKSLEPPPRLYIDSTKLAKTSSPNTVLDGPYVTSKPKFTSSSFRIFRHHHHHHHRRQASFDSNGSKSPERGQLISTVVLDKKKHKRKGIFPTWGLRNSKNGKKENGGGGGSSSSFVFPSSSTMDASEFGSCDETSYSTSVDMARIRRNGSLSNLSQAKPHFWAAVYEGFKQVMPWKSRKARKEGHVV